MTDPFGVPIGQVVDSVKDLETVKETDKCVALLPRAFRALLCRPEMWIMRRNHKVKVFALELEKELLKNDPDKIIEPPLYVAVPALQAVSYSMDSDELRNMYVKLLARAMNSDSTGEVHPSMVEVIKQMSPLEAQILKKLDKRVDVPYFNIIRKNNGTHGKGLLYKYLSEFDPKDALSIEFRPLPSSVAFSNLERLGIFTIQDDAWLENDSLYENLLPVRFAELIKNVNQLIEKQNGTYSVETQKGYASLTPFGKLFIKICLT